MNNQNSKIDINNVMVTAYIYDDNSERVEFSKQKIADIIDNHTAVNKAEYRDSIPKNTRIYTDDYKMVTLSNKSITAREPSTDRAKEAIQQIVTVMDELDDNNNLNDLWSVEYNVSSVVSSGRIDYSVDLYNSKSIFENHYKYARYYDSIGYIKLDTQRNGDIYLYESGKYTVKGSKSEAEAREISEEFENLIESIKHELYLLSDEVQEIRNKDSDITAHDLLDMNPDDI